MSAISPARVCSIFFFQVFLTVELAAAGELQTIQFRSSSGDIEEIQSNVRDLEKVSQLLTNQVEHVTEICAKGNSTWIGYATTNYSETLPAIQYTILGNLRDDGQIGRKCERYLKVQSIRHVGNLESSAPGISLYTGNEFQGYELYFSGNWLQLPKPENFQSVGFTGENNWSVREGQGKMRVCIARNSNSAGDISEEMKNYPVAIRARQLTVQYIWRHCAGEMRPRLAEGKSEIQSTLTLSKLNSTVPSEALVMKATATSLAELRLIKPYVFTILQKQGPGSWQLYSGLDFDGESYCFSADSKRSWGKAKLYENGITVGSIKLGCNHTVGSALEEIPGSYEHDPNLLLVDDVTTEDSSSTIQYQSLILGSFVIFVESVFIYMLIVPSI